MYPSPNCIKSEGLWLALNFVVWCVMTCLLVLVEHMLSPVVEVGAEAEASQLQTRVMSLLVAPPSLYTNKYVGEEPLLLIVVKR